MENPGLDHVPSLPALSSLPETVKRNILSRLLDSEAVKTSQSQQKQTSHAAQTPGHIPDLDEIAGRHLQLPLMCAGAAIVDNVLSSDEVKVRANACECTPGCCAGCTQTL
jgi:hypothetical protein